MFTMTNKKLSALNAGTVKLGNFKVNRLGFGAMRITGEGIWGPPSDVVEAREVLQRAVDLDVNFIDTADAYGPAVSEQLIHDTLHPYDGLIIATKGGMVRGGPGQWQPDGRPNHIRAACDKSLDRLSVERITLYQFHRPDPKVPFETTLKAFINLKHEGKIRYIGLSNVSLEQLKRALEFTQVVSVQNHYNFEHRKASDPVVDFCEAKGIAFIPYFPLGGGTSDYSQDVTRAIADKHDITVHQLALAWALARSPVMLPIPGTSSIKHLEENIAAAGVELDTDDMARLATLSD